MRPLILVVDNNLADLDLIQEVLPLAGISASFDTAVDGAEALERLRAGSAQRPDLVLLDLNLWGIHGREVLEMVKADRSLRGIPIFILTTSPSDDQRALCMQLGADGFFIKPRSVHGYGELAGAVRVVIDRAAATPT